MYLFFFARTYKVNSVSRGDHVMILRDIAATTHPQGEWEHYIYLCTSNQWTKLKRDVSLLAGWLGNGEHSWKTRLGCSVQKQRGKAYEILSHESQFSPLPPSGKGGLVGRMHFTAFHPYILQWVADFRWMLKTAPLGETIQDKSSRLFYLPPPHLLWYPSCEEISQAFPSCFCILQVITNWEAGASCV